MSEELNVLSAPPGASEEELKGVEAIQYLLSLTGESEPEDVSLANWRKFSDGEKVTTMGFYALFKRGELVSREDN